MTSEDKETGLISLFHIVESLTLTLSKTKPAEPIMLRLTSVWMRDPDDENPEHDFRIVLRLPGAPKGGVELYQGQFCYTAPCWRLSLDFPVLGAPASGMLYVECSIRPTGEAEWVSQSHPILLKVIEVSEAREGEQQESGLPSSAQGDT